jgi:hypothetical protein
MNASAFFVKMLGEEFRVTTDVVYHHVCICLVDKCHYIVVLLTQSKTPRSSGVSMHIEHVRISSVVPPSRFRLTELTSLTETAATVTIVLISNDYN